MRSLDRPENSCGADKRLNDQSDFALHVAHQLLDPGVAPSRFTIHDYRCGHVEIHVHIRVRFGEDDLQEWCALHCGTLGEQNLEGPRIGANLKTIDHGGSAAYSHDVQKPVFVHVIEKGEPFERGEPVGSPSVVRLQHLDTCLHRLAELLDMRTVLDEQFARAADWELKIAGFDWGIDKRASERKHSVIQRRAKIVGGVAQHDRPAIEAARRIEGHVDEVLASIEVHCAPDMYWVEVTPSVHFGIEGLEVFHAAVELCLTAGEQLKTHESGTVLDVKDERTQTTPKGEDRKKLQLPGEGGTKIPVPARDEVLAALRRAVHVSADVSESQCETHDT